MSDNRALFPETSEGIPLNLVPKWKPVLNIASLAALLIAAFVYLKIDLGELISGLPDFFMFFWENFFPPKYRNIAKYVPYIMDTVLFALVGTYISAILSFLFGLFMSRKHSPFPPLRLVLTAIASLFRNVPFLVWGTLFIFIFGIGNMVGLLALSVMTLGFLSRSYAVSIDEISQDKVDALRATGASKFQILIHGIIPEFIPAWLNWTLFIFEINIRASAVLGMVGAGGMGIMIQTNIRLFKYHESLSLIIVLVVIILLTELVTGTIRKAIR